MLPSFVIGTSTRFLALIHNWMEVSRVRAKWSKRVWAACFTTVVIFYFIWRFFPSLLARRVLCRLLHSTNQCLFMLIWRFFPVLPIKSSQWKAYEINTHMCSWKESNILTTGELLCLLINKLISSLFNIISKHI